MPLFEEKFVILQPKMVCWQHTLLKDNNIITI